MFMKIYIRNPTCVISFNTLAGSFQMRTEKLYLKKINYIENHICYIIRTSDFQTYWRIKPYHPNCLGWCKFYLNKCHLLDSKNFVWLQYDLCLIQTKTTIIQNFKCSPTPVTNGNFAASYHPVVMARKCPKLMRSHFPSESKHACTFSSSIIRP